MNRPNFFDDGSPYLSHPLLTEQRTVTEIDFVLDVLKPPPGSRLLDVGCGYGRHTVELARRGFAVTGIDPSATMIRAARDNACEAGTHVDLRTVAAEEFTADQPFDAALCLFTTLGQISSTGENTGLLHNVFAALRPGGGLIVEAPQRDAAVARLSPHDKFGDDEVYTAVAREFDAASNVVTEKFELVNGDQVRTYLLCYRLFSHEELVGLLAASGFAVTASFSGYGGAPLTAAEPTMIVVARK